MKRIVLLSFVFSILSLTSCELLEDILNTVEEEADLTTEEIVNGLKTALTIGADTSVTTLSTADGFYRDLAVKILLPPEALDLQENLNNEYLQALGVDEIINAQLEELELRINRSAEAAAAVDDTKQIFVDAITDMSIENALDILQGNNLEKNDESYDSLAATHYFMTKTYSPLTQLFSPIINTVLDDDLVGGISANDAWYGITDEYNNALQQGVTVLGITITVADATGYQPVDTEIDEYVTQKALDGLYLKVGQEEKKIRRDPWQWASDIIHRVFGSVYQESSEG